jgi:hypothetical protein
MATPSYTSGQVASVVHVPDIDDSCRQLMLDFCPVFPLDTGVLLRLLVALISGVLVWLLAPSVRGEMLVTLAVTGSLEYAGFC